LQHYDDYWPIADATRLQLKYTASRARLQEQKLAAGRGKRLREKELT